MNTEEAIKHKKAVIESAKLWVVGESTICNQVELTIIAEHYNVNLPYAMGHFRYSNNPEHACLTGAPNTVLKTLRRLANAIRKAEGMKGELDVRKVTI